ncbi:damage-inducible protein DinB [Gramella jeungdoensis]|uniref:Damage-inducible protein DinB n=1 Tax=Gramella jeungdoensis TaxID=708091 RepID=A0ABT0YX89_9FLAO|nr:DinB family protein [Gramella jeungdoensis]MCM8568082.1 damage-inducible protein DinB [Gramella jeungdoensis]
MKEHLKDLLEYSHHFNTLLIKKFNDGDLHLAIPESTLRLFSHILNAQKIWNFRIEGDDQKVDVWKVYHKEDLMEIENENFERSVSICERSDLNKKISYTNSKGEQYQNSIHEILFHIVNHSTYHRGQIAAELRKSGLEPVVSDYIFYKREN